MPMLTHLFHSKPRTLLCALAAASLTAAVLCVVFFGFSLFPFGGKTLAWGDMKQQFIPLLLDFRDICTGKASMLFNLQNAGGMSFWGVFFFFLSSPFSLLILLVEKGQVYDLANVLVFLKLLLCAATAAVFFASIKKLSRCFVILFSVSYAFCGFGLLYYQNCLWLDLLCMFPLTMVCLLRLLNGKNAWPFCLFLVFTITLSYYLSYMVLLAILLFCGLSFLFPPVNRQEGLCARQDRRRGAAALCTCVVGALGITAVVWLPAFIQCCNSPRTQSILQGLLQSSIFTDIHTTLPIIYCSILCVSLPVLLWKSPITPLRGRLLAMLVFTLLPLFFEPVNKMWHIGSYQAFPARYGYIPLFMGLWLAADLCARQDFPLRGPGKTSLLHPLAALMGGISVSYGIWLLAARFEKLTSYTSTLWLSNESTYYLLSFVGLSAVGVCLLLYCIKGNNRHKKTCTAGLLVLVLFQSFFFSSVFIGGGANSFSLEAKLLNTYEPTDHTELYRVKMDTSRYAVNLAGALGYPTLNHYTSLTDNSFYSTIKKLGYSAYWMEVSSLGGTEISDFLLSHRYAINPEGKLSAAAAANGIGLLVEAGRLPEIIPAENRLATQNQLFRTLTGREGIHFYVPEKQEANGQLIYRYEIPVTRQETLYLDAFEEISNRLREEINGALDVSVNGRKIRNAFPAQRDNGILNLGSFREETVVVEIAFHKNEKAEFIALGGLYQADMALLKKFVQGTKASQNGNSIVFSANAAPGEALFVSIAHYRGMQVTVNGAKTPVRSVLDSFWEVPLQPGENQVVLTYIPQGLTAGFIITCATLLLMMALWLIRKTKFYSLLLRFVSAIAFPVFITTFFTGIFCIYLLPMLLLMG